MKTSPKTSFFLLAAVAVCGGYATSLRAQTTGNADPVGFVMVSVSGTGGASSQLSFAALGLTRPVEYQGSGASIGTNTITDAAASWTTNRFSSGYFLEITSVGGSATAAGVGTTYNITSNSSGTLTLETNLSTDIVAPVAYKIRKHWTIGSLFGAKNTANLRKGTATTADLIQLWNGSDYDSFYYQTGSGGTGWRKVGNKTADVSGTVIFFDECVIVKRTLSAGLSFVLNGTIKTGQTTIPVVNGSNYVGNFYPLDLTLASSGLYTGSSATGLASGNATTADHVLVWNGTGLDTYYYSSDGPGGWRKGDDASTDVGATVLASGAGFILRRIDPSSFNWVVPAPSSFGL